ncbi:3-isopropylmalate dehydratase [Archaeoglobales archaeon]|nr:MAG: 3-isopropylmalate dehydratase [Archaeoglobales archaeon]
MEIFERLPKKSQIQSNRFKEIARGKAWKFGDDISTDHITPGRYYHLRSNLQELAKHVMEDADPDFVKKMEPSDFIVAGENFGMGSSREHAPLTIKIAGVSAVIAKSFARIFYRNSINVGLPLLIADTDSIESGDELEVNFKEGIVNNLTKGEIIKAKPLPNFMLKIIEAGGLVAYIKEKGDLLISE